jgi:hypothetical protein
MTARTGSVCPSSDTVGTPGIDEVPVTYTDKSAILRHGHAHVSAFTVTRPCNDSVALVVKGDMVGKLVRYLKRNRNDTAVCMDLPDKKRSPMFELPMDSICRVSPR